MNYNNKLATLACYAMVLLLMRSSVTAKEDADSHLVSQTSQNQGYCTDGDDCKQQELHIVMILTRATPGSNLAVRFEQTIDSVLKHAKSRLHFTFVTDTNTRSVIHQAVNNVKSKYPSCIVKSTTHLVEDVLKKIYKYVEKFQPMFSSKGSYYNDAIFFLSVAMHKFLPSQFKRVVMMDSDLKFTTDIANLFNLFNQFEPNNIIGIARENQPVYRHVFWQYRNENRNTKVGDPPPDGLTGFNSGVLLLDLQRMRNSKLFANVTDGKLSENLASKYHFRGHLGDQDLYTLLHMEYNDMFYVLPCTWNRQLCTYWRDHGYKDVFDLYYTCPGRINVYHGNCNTPIPADDE